MLSFQGIDPLVRGDPLRKPIIQLLRIAGDSCAIPCERPVGVAELVMAEPAHIGAREPIAAEEPPVLVKQAAGMVHRIADRNEDHRIRKCPRQGLQAQQMIVVLAQVAGLAGAAQRQSHQIAIPGNQLLVGHMRHKAVRKYVVAPGENPPVDLVQCFRAVEIDRDAVAMGALRFWSRLAAIAREPLPQIGCKHERHVGISQRSEFTGAMKFRA